MADDFDPDAYLASPPTLNVRSMSYGPIQGEYNRAAMVGPNQNPLQPYDIAASPDLEAAGYGQGDWVNVNGQLHRIADSSYRAQGVPNRNSIELRDQPDLGRATVTPAPFDPDAYLGQKTTTPAAEAKPDSTAFDPDAYLKSAGPGILPSEQQEIAKAQAAMGGVRPDPMSSPEAYGAQVSGEPQLSPQDQQSLADKIKPFLQGLDIQSIPKDVLENLTPLPGAYHALHQAYDVVRGVPVEQAIPESQQFVGIEQKPLEERIKTGLNTAIQLAFAHELGGQVIPQGEAPVITPGKTQADIEATARAEPAGPVTPPVPGTLADDVNKALERRFTMPPTAPEAPPQFAPAPELDPVLQALQNQRALQERRFTMLQEPPTQLAPAPDIDPVLQALEGRQFGKVTAEGVIPQRPLEGGLIPQTETAQIRQPEPVTTLGPWTPETGNIEFPEQTAAPATGLQRETASIADMIRQQQEPNLAEKITQPEIQAEEPAGLPSAKTVPPSPGEELNAPTDIRPVSEGLPPGELAQAEQQRAQETAGVSTQNRYTGGRREVLGMEPAEATVPRSDQSVQDAAEALLRRTPDAGYDLAKELAETPRPIADVENAVLSKHIAGLEKQHSDLVEHINKTGDVAATEQLNTVRDNLQQAFDAAKNTGTELGRGLRQRQVEEAAQYTLPKMEAERRAVNGGKPLSPDQLKQVQDVFKRMQDAQKKVASAEDAVAKGKAPKARGGLVEYLDKQAEAARQRIIERRGRLNVGFDPTALADEAIIGASHIARGVRNFDAWSSRMLQDFGERVRPYLRQLYERAMQTTKETANSLRKSTKPTGSTAEAIKEFKRQDIYKTRTLKQTEALKGKIAAGDVTPPASRAALVLDPQAQKFRAEYERAKYDYQVMLEKDRLANRPALKKIIDTAVDLERAIKLTGIKTFGKLGSAGLARVGQTAAEEAVGKAMSLVPGLRRVMQAAPTEGTPTLRSAAAYVKGGLKGIKEIPGVIKGEITSRDVREGGTPKVPSVLDIPGRLHGAVKQPFKAAQESMALQKAIDTASRQGQDINKPGVIEGAQARAKESGLRAIMTNDNVLSNGWNNFVSALEQNKKFPTAGYGAAKVARFLLPIVRVPTNIALEVGSMTTGLGTGTAKLAQVMARGMETIKPEEADMIARHYKKGLVGAGLFLTGYFNADKFAGFYQQSQGTKKADRIARGGMQPGQAKFGAMTIPDWLIMHSPAGLMMQFGATVKKYQDTGKSAPTSAIAGAGEIVHEVPFINEMARIDDMLKSNWEGERARGQLLKGTVVPQGVQNISDWLDPYKRAPKTPLQYIQSGVPWWREQLPISKHQ